MKDAAKDFCQRHPHITYISQNNPSKVCVKSIWQRHRPIASVKAGCHNEPSTRSVKVRFDGRFDGRYDGRNAPEMPGTDGGCRGGDLKRLPAPALLWCGGTLAVARIKVKLHYSDCVFAYCASVAQYVYSLSAEHCFRLSNIAISDERVRDCALCTHSVFRPKELLWDWSYSAPLPG